MDAVETENALVRDAMDSLRPGDHVGLICDRSDLWWQVAVQFLAQGLAKGEHCSYLGESYDFPILTYLLENLGLDVTAARNRGQLQLSVAATYFAPRERIDLNHIFSLVASGLQSALAQGYPAVRVVSDASWVAPRGAGDLRLVAEYERRLNDEVFPYYPLTAMCLYDLRLFPAHWQDMASQTHSCLLSEGGFHRQDMVKDKSAMQWPMRAMGGPPNCEPY